MFAEMYKQCQTDALKNALWLEDRIVCLPSSVVVSGGVSGGDGGH